LGDAELTVGTVQAALTAVIGVTLGSLTAYPDQLFEYATELVSDWFVCDMS
jgi:ABC-type dipeptide/oligopeptide/nickel transport system permease subunit